MPVDPAAAAQLAAITAGVDNLRALIDALRALLDTPTPPPVIPPPATTLDALNMTPRAWKRTITPEDYGASGDGTTNDIAALRAMWDDAEPYDRILLGAGKTYRFEDPADHLYFHESIPGSKSHITVMGHNSTVHATLDAQSGWQFENVNDLQVHGVTKTSTWGRNPANRGSSPHHHGITWWNCNDLVVKDVTVRGSYAAGLFFWGCKRVVADRPTVINTSADGFHLTGPTSDVQVWSPTIVNAGDDGFAVIGYLSDAVPVSNVKIVGARIRGQYNGRGVSILGGNNVHLADFDIHGSRAAALYLGGEENADFATLASSNISAIGGRITASPQAAATEGHPAILLLNQCGGTRTVDQVEIGDIHILDVPNGQAAVRMERSTNDLKRVTIRDLYLTGRYITNPGWIGTVINKQAGITTPTTARLLTGGKWVA